MISFINSSREPSPLAMQTIHDHTPAIGAIDLGTNSCRLLVAVVNVVGLYRNFFKPRPPSEQALRIVDSFSRVVGLGEGVKQTGVLSKGAIDRAIDALAVCKRKLVYHNVSTLRAIATEACRQAENAHVLVSSVREQLDIDLEIITPQEEAQLVLGGCAGVISEHTPYGIVIDIGGGSTEVIWLRVARKKNYGNAPITVVDSMSLPYGVVTLRDTYIHLAHDPEIFKTAQRSIAQAMRFFINKNNIGEYLREKAVQIVASSGTATTLGAMVLGLEEYDRQQVDARDFASHKLQKVGNVLLREYLEKSVFNFQINERYEHLLARLKAAEVLDASPALHVQLVYARVGLLAAGTVILDSILEAIGPQTIRIADRGIREGILMEIIEKMRLPC